MTALPSEKEWYTSTEVATLLGIHDSTMRLLIREGRYKPDLRTPGDHARFRRSTVQRILKQAQKESGVRKRAS